MATSVSREDPADRLVPGVLGALGTLIRQPDNYEPAARWLGSLLDTAPPGYTFGALEAAVVIGQAILDAAEHVGIHAIEDLTNSTVHNPDDLTGKAGVDVAVVFTDARGMLLTEAGGIERRDYANYVLGRVPEAQLVAVVFAVLGMTVAWVFQIAEATGRPVLPLWKDLATALSEA